MTPADQTIAWSTPADIVYGTLLGAAQLDATVAVAGPDSTTGTLSYSPDFGTVLHAGAHQTLKVTAAATTNYHAASMMVTMINVAPAPLTVTADDASIVAGQALPALTAHYAGFVRGEGPGVLGGVLGFSVPASAARAIGRTVPDHSLVGSTLPTTRSPTSAGRSTSRNHQSRLSPCEAPSGRQKS